MLLALGFAFRDRAPEPLSIEIRGPRAAEIEKQINQSSKDLLVVHFDDDLWQKRLQSGRIGAVIETGSQPFEFKIWNEERREESRTARFAIESALLKDTSKVKFDVEQLDAPGSRYIDFLVPGMLAMNLMSGGLWGVGFGIVDMRVRKLLKRLMATPMPKSYFLLSLMFVRLLFGVCEQAFILLFGYFVFNVHCQGSYFDLILVLFIGGTSFVGIGLLVASRAQSIEAVSGLMNLTMIPMWILGGIFFNNERFPELIQPIIKILPIVSVVDSIRDVMLDGKSIVDLTKPLLITAAWGIGSFLIAAKIFRWK
jgi:ABC-type multidrug transport system permease subunit